ncbi:MAG: outer membrane beta-barrel protein [Deltaproteobacteria bacterium]|jgi:opacity protein-like surface antigen|nr:outer membrane beta-barrel protein [Deltaproteobacteria bacterium]
MRRLILLFVFLSLSANVYAASGFYAPLYLGYGKAQVSDIKETLSFQGVKYEATDDGKYKDSNLALGAGLGYDFSVNHKVPIRLEADLVTRLSSITVFDDKYAGDYEKLQLLNMTTLMFNSYVDLPIGDSVKPYLGLGIGYGFGRAAYEYNIYLSPLYSQRVKGKKSSYPGGFAAAIHLGLKFKVNDTWSAGVGYRGTLWSFDKNYFSHRELSMGWKGDVHINELMFSLFFTQPSQ